MMSPRLNPSLNGKLRNSFSVMFRLSYHRPWDSHHGSNRASCSMLPDTTATMGCVVDSTNPRAGKMMNLISTNARMTFTSQLHMELSSQMNFHTFLQLSALRDRAMGTSRNETNKNLSIFRCSVKSVHSNYFEGILQLRNPTPAVLDFVQHNGSRQEGC